MSFLKRCLLEDPDRAVWDVPNEEIYFILLLVQIVLD